MFTRNILGTLGCCLVLASLKVECSEPGIREHQSIVATSQLGSPKILDIVGHDRMQINEIDVFLEQKLSGIPYMSPQNRLSYIFSLVRALGEFVLVETKTDFTALVVTFPSRTGSEVTRLTSAIQRDVKREEPMGRSIVDAGISSVLATSITNFLSGMDVEGSAEAIRYNVCELLAGREPDKAWLMDIIAPLETGNEGAKKLYTELFSQINK